MLIGAQFKNWQAEKCISNPGRDYTWWVGVILNIFITSIVIPIREPHNSHQKTKQILKVTHFLYWSSKKWLQSIQHLPRFSKKIHRKSTEAMSWVTSPQRFSMAWNTVHTRFSNWRFRTQATEKVQRPWAESPHLKALPWHGTQFTPVFRIGYFEHRPQQEHNSQSYSNKTTFFWGLFRNRLYNPDPD